MKITLHGLEVHNLLFCTILLSNNVLFVLLGSIFGSTNNLNILSQTRENYLIENYVPDWTTTYSRQQIE